MSPEQDNDTLRKAPKVDTAQNVPTPQDIGNVKVLDWKPGYGGHIVKNGSRVKVYYILKNKHGTVVESCTSSPPVSPSKSLHCFD